jgi:ATP-dependent DNA helicase RecQ
VAVSDEALVLEEVGFDPELYERLKELRSEIAKAENIPAYAVFPNQTLETFTRLRPKSMKLGRTIRGVGEAKADRYLAQFITVIQTYG